MSEINEKYFRRYAYKLAEANILAGDAKVCETVCVNFPRGTKLEEIRSIAAKVGAEVKEYTYEPGSSYMWICTFEFLGITFVGACEFDED